MPTEPIYLTTVNGKVAITRYKRNEYFCWHKSPSGGWVVSHIPTGVRIAETLKEDNAEQLAESLAVIGGEEWSEEGCLQDEELKRQIYAAIQYWTAED